MAEPKSRFVLFCLFPWGYPKPKTLARSGYGKVDFAYKLLEAGASTSAANDQGQIPAEVAALNDKNPVAVDTALMEKLRAGTEFRDE